MLIIFSTRSEEKMKILFWKDLTSDPPLEKQGGKERLDILFSPYRLLIIIVISIFAAQIYINVIFYLLPPLSLPVQAILGSLLLISSIFPMLYFFLLRPMALHINERRQAEEALRDSEEKYHTLFEQSKDPIYITTTAGEFIDINSSMVDLFHYTREEMMKLNSRELYVHPEDRDRFQQEIEKNWTVKDFEAEFHTKDGTEIDGLVTSTVWRDKEGRIIGYQGMIRDITERKQAEVKLKYLSTHDSLTGLYNRTYFEEEMNRLERGRKFPVSIVMADVDGLKKINDTYGHAAGDELLQRTAELMKSSFRADDVVARIGGDEFAVFLPYTDASSVEFVLNRVKISIESHNTASQKDPLSLSFGVATCEKGERLANVLKEADRFMYQNKLARKQAS